MENVDSLSGAPVRTLADYKVLVPRGGLPLADSFTQPEIRWVSSNPLFPSTMVRDTIQDVEKQSADNSRVSAKDETRKR